MRELKTTESDMKKCAGHSNVMVVQNKPIFKKKGTSWKKKGKAKDTIPKAAPKQKAGPAYDTECFFCHEHGHWKRNCSKYQASLKKSGSKSTSHSCTLVVNVSKKRGLQTAQSNFVGHGSIDDE